MEYNKKRRAEDNSESKKRKLESDLSGDEYEVEAIENHKYVDGKNYYRVKWKGYDERTWEPSQNLNNCKEKLHEYKLGVRGRQEPNKLKKGERDDDSSTTTKSSNQRVVAKKDAKTINYKRFSNGSKYSLPTAFKISKGDASNNTYPNNTHNKKKDDSNSVTMPLEVRLPPFGPGDRSINFKNKPPKWYGIICRIRNEEEMNVGKVQITNYTEDSMENFPCLNQSRLVINRFIMYSDLEGFLTDSFNKFPIYLVTISTSIKDEMSELDRLQSFLLKRFKVGVINIENLTLYLLPTSETSSELLGVDRPSNVNDLYFVLQLPKNELSNYLKSQPSSTKKYKSSKSTKQLTYHEAQRNNLPPISTSPPRRPIQKSFNPNNETTSNLELQSPTKKYNVPSSSSRPTQASVHQNKDDMDIQFPSPKRHKSYAGIDQFKVHQKNMLPNIQSVRPTNTIPKEISKPIVANEPVKYSVNLNEFDGLNFTVVGSAYVESQRVIAYLKEMGGNEVLAKDPSMDCVIFHQNELTRGFSFKNYIIYKYKCIKFFLIIKEDTTLTLREIFKMGGVILLTSVSIKSTDNIVDKILSFTNAVSGWDFKIHPNILSFLQRLLTFLSDNEFMKTRLEKAFKGIVDGLISGKIKYLLPNEMSLEDYDMDSDRITFGSMECLIKVHYDKYRHFVVIDENYEPSVENEMIGIETMSIEKLKQEFEENREIFV